MSIIGEIVGFARLRVVRLFALTVLIVVIGTECFFTKLLVIDPDVWWHISVGSWIVQHHSFPESGIFSRTAGTRPWRAYSWGFEVPLSRAYEWFSFMGIGVFGTILTIAVALAVFVMLYRLSRRFWAAWALSIVVYSAFLFNIAPRPVFFTAILYAITLTLILESQRSGRIALLYWLPLVFVFWANSHIQFFYGIAVVGLFAGVNLLQSMAISWRIYPEFLTRPTLPLKPLFAVFAACLLASCIGPYSFHLYEVVFGYATSKIIYSILNEMQALSFKYFNQYVELLLAAGGFFAVGLRKRIDPFKLALLMMAVVLGFRTWRDAWFMCMTAAALIVDSPPRENERESIRLWDWAIVTAASCLLLLVVVRNTDFNARGLDSAISRHFPVKAANFLRRNPVGGPVYNSFDWGGFLIFYMPDYPVSIDGRTDLYGDAMDDQYYQSQEAKPSYKTDPYLNESGVVIFNTKFPLAQMLMTDPRFRVVYRDDLAVVLARNW
jgi:hypothetical protein